MSVSAIIFDVGKVLYDWNPRFLYAKVFEERLIADDRALDAFLQQVVTPEWHVQHDAGRAFADTSAELIAAFPQHRTLIALWGERFGETIRGPLPGMGELVAELHARGVPLFAITNFSAEFWAPFRLREAAMFDRFRDIVVSGEERLMKPDPAIFMLALDRFGLSAHDALFVDDAAKNVAAAQALGMAGHVFEGADRFRAELVRLGLVDQL
ncbi:MAG: HAD family hydrolase [Sphingomonas sp.]